MISSSDKKKQLLKQSALYKEELEEEFEKVKYRTDELLKKALIIGGSLALTYFLFRQLSDSKKKKIVIDKKTTLLPNNESVTEEVEVRSAPSQFSVIAAEVGTALAQQATAFLLQLAKDKLLELLQPKETTINEDENS